MSEIIQRLEEKRVQARLAAWQPRINAQHGKGKLTARERINLLFDEGSFEEWDMFVEHRTEDSAWVSKKSRATALSPATAPSTAGRCSCSARTSRCSAARS